MITREQKEEILFLADNIRIAQASSTWEESSWSSLNSTKKQAEKEVEDSIEALEQFLETITA